MRVFQDQIHHFQVKELRNQGDEVAREVMVRVVEGGEGAGSQRRDFEELMRLVRAVPIQITLGRSEVGVGRNGVP